MPEGFLVETHIINHQCSFLLFSPHAISGDCFNLSEGVTDLLMSWAHERDFKFIVVTLLFLVKLPLRDRLHEQVIRMLWEIAVAPYRRYLI